MSECVCTCKCLSVSGVCGGGGGGGRIIGEASLLAPGVGDGSSRGPAIPSAPALHPGLLLDTVGPSLRTDWWG